MGNHLSCCDEKGSKFRFRRRGHDKFDDLGNRENCTIESWEGDIFGEEDMGASTASSLCFVEEAGICVSTQNHVTCAIYYAIIWVSGNIVQ